MDWYPYDNGKTIGTRGSESGIVILDIETPEGARITLEEKTTTAPFAVTLGIYGLMFHTNWFSMEGKAREYIETVKTRMAAIFNHYLILEENRDDSWNDRLNQLINELVV